MAQPYGVGFKRWFRFCWSARVLSGRNTRRPAPTCRGTGPSSPPPRRRRPQPKSSWSNGGPAFSDPTLIRLIDRAIANNYQLRIARQRLIAARADRDIVAAADYPQIEALAQGSLANSSTTLQYPPGIGQYRSYQFGLDASYEIDVFGGNRRAEQAAAADVGASIEDRRRILVSLVAEIAGDYAALRTTQVRLRIAQENVELGRQLVDLTNTEFKRGLTTSLAVAQATAQMETVRATVPPLNATAHRLSHAIAVLSGELPGALEAQLLVTGPAVPIPPTLPLTLPSEVVANRPDIREAERRLAASTAQVGEAIASLYPHFTIPLMLTPDTSYLSEAFSAASLVWNVGLSIKQDIYTGGRDTARIDRAKAAAEADRLAYQQTVLNAFREVEDAIANFQTETQRHARLAAALDSSRTAYDRARRLYAAGLTDFLNLLTTERALYATEDQIALSELAEIQEVITLYKALGGGWQSVTFGDEAEKRESCGRRGS